MLDQIVTYLIKHKLIHPNHHRNLKTKSTQTLVQEIIDILVELIDKGEDISLIAMNQSTAFDVVSHAIYLRKLKAIKHMN